jgi:hypothetical protein
VRYNKRADEEGRKHRDEKYLKRAFTELPKCKKPTGDPDRTANVTRPKQIEKMIDESVWMTTINDAERGDSSSEDEDEDDESESESDSPAKERRPRPATVERLRTPREEITEHISQRDKIMTQVSSVLKRSNSTDLSSTLEKVTIIQMLENEVQTEQPRSRQFEDDNRALREKYDSKVAEVHAKAAEISKLELRLFMAGAQKPQARNGIAGAFPWSSPVGHRRPGLPNFVGDREEQQYGGLL